MSFWSVVNRAVYRVWYGLRHRRRPPPPPCPLPPGEGPPEVLCLGWGRIGDTVLFTGALKHLRTLCDGCRLVYAGRPAVRPVVEPLVDAFVPLHDERALQRRWTCVLTDLHFFYGGVAALGGLLEALPAPRKFLYEGYHVGPGLAPAPPPLAGVEVVPALAKPAGAPLDRYHLLRDARHYVDEVARRLTGAGLDADDWRPVLFPTRVEETLSRFELVPGSYVAWQPSSNNRKKDYPLPRWREVLAAFPRTWFVALGTEGPAVGAPNLLDLRGRTDLAEATAVITGAGAFLGPDSGLTHIAAVLGRPTVCVAQNANLGYFFPYPPEMGFDHLTVVDHAAYRECARCFMACAHESIVATWLRGAKCLRELPAARVIEALGGVLARAPVTTG